MATNKPPGPVSKPEAPALPPAPVVVATVSAAKPAPMVAVARPRGSRAKVKAALARFNAK